MTDGSALNVSHLKGELGTGRMARNELLEEIERHLDRNPERPLTGALELVLELLHQSPSDPHLLRVLKRLYEQDGHGRDVNDFPTPALEAGSADEEGPSTVRDRLIVSRALLEAGFIDDAETNARAAIELEPNSLAALNLLAKIHHTQGKLSAMIELWRAIQARSPLREDALAYLGFLHRMSQDESFAGAALVAVGDGVYARKHESQLEIEKAFAKFRERNFEAAIAQCERFAAASKNSPAIYKLAVLQKAWIQERTDDLAGAQQTLQQLGRERGFETDLDRLGFLARVCERLGTSDSTEQALHIYEHLNLRHGKLSALPRLAALNAQRGDQAKARAYAAEYERRFTKRMQKPSAAELLRALALRYIPLGRVSRGPLTAEDIQDCELELQLAKHGGARRRRRALLAFLRDDVAKAERLFARLTQSRWAVARDHAYLGDLRNLTGAAPPDACYAKALTGGMLDEPMVWRSALATRNRKPLEGAIASMTEQERTRAHACLLAAARRDHANTASWRDLAELETLLARNDEARQHQRKAEQLTQVHAEARPLGRVLVAAVYSLNGKPKGVIHELVAARYKAPGDAAAGQLAERDILGNVMPDLRTLARWTFDVVYDYARETWPHLVRDVFDYRYTMRFSKDDEPSSGNSAGLPMAIALLSVLLDRPVPQHTCLTGALVGDSARELAVRRVGDAVYKVKGAYHRGLRRIIVPADNRDDIESGELVPASIASQIVGYARNLDDAVRELWGEQAWDW